jgi:hypothetical protein
MLLGVLNLTLDTHPLLEVSAAVFGVSSILQTTLSLTGLGSSLADDV